MEAKTGAAEALDLLLGHPIGLCCWKPGLLGQRKQVVEDKFQSIA